MFLLFESKCLSKACRSISDQYRPVEAFLTICEISLEAQILFAENMHYSTCKSLLQYPGLELRSKEGTKLEAFSSQYLVMLRFQETLYLSIFFHQSKVVDPARFEFQAWRKNQVPMVHAFHSNGLFGCMSPIQINSIENIDTYTFSIYGEYYN